jgi:hypothetical protein
VPSDQAINTNEDEEREKLSKTPKDNKMRLNIHYRVHGKKNGKIENAAFNFLSLTLY